MIALGFTTRDSVADKPLGYFEVAAGAMDTAVTLAALCGGALPEGTCLVIFKPTVNAVRFRDDGVAPTAGVGFPIPQGASQPEVYFTGANLSGIQLIAQIAGAGADILCYGR